MGLLVIMLHQGNWDIKELTKLQMMFQESLLWVLMLCILLKNKLDRLG
jgi:hypothetical protein